MHVQQCSLTFWNYAQDQSKVCCDQRCHKQLSHACSASRQLSNPVHTNQSIDLFQFQVPYFLEVPKLTYNYVHSKFVDIQDQKANV